MPVYFLRGRSTSERVDLIERRIREILPELKRIGSIEDIARHQSGGERIYVSLVAPAGERGYFDRLVDIASRYHELFFILISDEISASDYKRLVRTGGADWVSTAGAPHEMLDIIAKHSVPAPTVPEGPAHPVVISFLPSAGGVGNTTLAVEVAIRLKTQKSSRTRKVCLVDLDFQTSHACDYLDIEARLRIDEIAGSPERLDAHLFGIFTSHHSSGLDIFAAPRSQFDFSTLDVRALDALFNMIAPRYDLVLIDLPVAWLPWTSQLINGSDGVIVTGINTIPCLRQIAERLAAVKEAKHSPGEIAIAVNRCRRGLIGGIARRQHVESVLVGEKFFLVGEDAAAVDSINTGVPLGLGSSGSTILKDIVPIADFCAALKSARVAAASQPHER
jgi:pilus assembly protein CpaE